MGEGIDGIMSPDVGMERRSKMQYVLHADLSGQGAHAERLWRAAQVHHEWRAQGHHACPGFKVEQSV